MITKEQQYIDRLKSLEETIAEYEPKLIQLEKDFKENERKYNYWKTSYSENSDYLSKKGCIVFVISVVVFFIFLFSGTLSSVFDYLIIIALEILFYFVITWDDRESLNSSKKLLDDYEKNYNKIRPIYEELKKKHDSDKNQYAALQNEFKIWKERREELIHSLTGIKPYEYIGFPLDPVINMSYYPLGNIDNPQKYIVYTANAHRYHKKYGCSGAYEEISISEALNKNLTPCFNCFRYRDFDYPDWVHTVHDKYLDFVKEARKHDINVFIDSNRQLSVELPSTPPPVLSES